MDEDRSSCAWRHDRCANCDALVALDRWHPVAAPADDASGGVYAFCGGDCRTTWLAARSAE